MLYLQASISSFPSGPSCRCENFEGGNEDKVGRAREAGLRSIIFVRFVRQNYRERKLLYTDFYDGFVLSVEEVEYVEPKKARLGQLTPLIWQYLGKA
jgi:hypothetical protein